MPEEFFTDKMEFKEMRSKNREKVAKRLSKNPPRINTVLNIEPFKK